MECIDCIHSGWGRATPPHAVGQLEWLVDPDAVPPEVFLMVERFRVLPAPREWPAPDEHMSQKLCALMELLEDRENTPMHGHTSKLEGFQVSPLE